MGQSHPPAGCASIKMQLRNHEFARFSSIRVPSLREDYSTHDMFAAIEEELPDLLERVESRHQTTDHRPNLAAGIVARVGNDHQIQHRAGLRLGQLSGILLRMDHRHFQDGVVTLVARIDMARKKQRLIVTGSPGGSLTRAGWHPYGTLRQQAPA